MDFTLTEEQEMLRRVRIEVAPGNEREGNMRIQDLSVEEFKALIQEAVEEKLEEVLGDPDQGLEVKPKIRERLERSLAAAARGEKGIPIERVAKELGLEW